MAVVYPHSFTKADLSNASADDLMLFLLAGHAANDVQILQRLLLMAVGALDQDKYANLPALAQAMLLSRVLITRLAASWDEISRDKYQRLLDRAEADLEARGAPAVEIAACRTGRETLGRLLADGSMLVRIRNKTGAHTDRKTLREAFDSASDEYEFIDLLSPIAGNYLHGAADDVATRALLETASNAESEVAIQELGELLTRAASALSAVASIWTMYFNITYLRVSFDKARKGSKNMHGVDITAISLPVFIEPPAD